MKKIIILLIFILLIPTTIFGKVVKLDKPTNISVVKEKDGVVLTIKNPSKEQELVKNNELQVEVDIRIDGKWSSELGSRLLVYSLIGIEKSTIKITQEDFNSLEKMASGYDIRVRYRYLENVSEFSKYIGIGSTDIFHNYSNWAYNDLKKAAKLGLITNSIKSNMKGEISREELSEIAVKAYEKIYNKKSQGGVNHFKDTENPYVNQAFDLNLIKGINKDTFAPSKKVTREDYAVILSNLYKLENSKNIKIKDSKKISKYAKESVNKTLNAGYLTLDNSKKFNPKKNITREEALASIVRGIK